MRENVGARVIVCASEAGKDAALSALQAGAVGYLRKDELTPETLSSAVRAAADGTSVVAPDMLEHLLAKLPENNEPKPAPGAADRSRAAGPGADRRRAIPPARWRSSSHILNAP